MKQHSLVEYQKLVYGFIATETVDLFALETVTAGQICSYELILKLEAVRSATPCINCAVILLKSIQQKNNSCLQKDQKQVQIKTYYDGIIQTNTNMLIGIVDDVWHKTFGENYGWLSSWSKLCEDSMNWYSDIELYCSETIRIINDTLENSTFAEKDLEKILQLYLLRNGKEKDCSCIQLND